VPLLIIDYLHEDFTIYHGGLLRRYLKEELRYVEGQILEVYEGWLGREKVRVVNARVTAMLGVNKIYLPRDDLLNYSIVPKTWIVFSAIRVGDPRREVYYPIYPGKIVPYIPSRDLIMSRLENIMLKMSGLSSRLAGFIYRGIGVVSELREEKARKKIK